MPGYIQQDKITDWVYGGYSGIHDDINNPNGQWLDYVPVMESQVIDDLDSYFCTTFSTLNCLEILHKWQTFEEINWSDLHNGLEAGTIPGGGNSVQVVADTIRSKGLVLESEMPFVKWTPDLFVPKKIKEKALKWLDTYAMNYESVRPSLENYHGDVMKALSYSPLAVGVAYANGDGILNPRSGANHLVALIGYKKGEYWLVMDSYQNKVKKYDWSYRFTGLVKFKLTIKETNMLNLIEGQVYLLVEGQEQKVAVAVDGKLMVGEKGQETLVLLQSAGRNNGDFGKVKVIPVSLVDWNTVPQTDLKGNRL